MAWTDDRVATLTKLWADGLSASQIAKQLGGVTRNAVIGKVHRLGLSGRAKPSSPARKAAARKTAASSASRARAASKSKPKSVRAPSVPRAPRVVVKAPVPPPPPPLEAKPMSNGEFATIMTITEHMCKWPIGDPGADNFRFCGRKTTRKSPIASPIAAWPISPLAAAAQAQIQKLSARSRPAGNVFASQRV